MYHNTDNLWWGTETNGVGREKQKTENLFWITPEVTETGLSKKRFNGQKRFAHLSTDDETKLWFELATTRSGHPNEVTQSQSKCWVDISSFT